MKFRLSRVKNYEYLIETLHLPDPDDRHVLAAAIRAKADLIVTYNLNDFPTVLLVQYKIEAISPDDFIMRLVRDNSEAVLQATYNHRTKLSRPSKMPGDYIATLEKQNLPKTVAFLREYIHEI